MANSVVYTQLNTWTANLLNNIAGNNSSFAQAMAYWGKRYLTSITTTTKSNSKDGKYAGDKRSKDTSKTTTVSFTFDQVYATKLLDAAANELGSARVQLFNLINVPEISPSIANGVITSFDQAIQSLFNFQKNTAGPLPVIDLYKWYLTNLRTLLISLQTKSKK